MSKRKIKTISWDEEFEFDRMVNRFLAEPYAAEAVVTFCSAPVAYEGGIKTTFIAHITYTRGSKG